VDSINIETRAILAREITLTTLMSMTMTSLLLIMKMAMASSFYFL
jgi:hypothetical protein